MGPGAAPVHMGMSGGHPSTVEGRLSFAVFFRRGGVGSKCPYEAVV